MGYREMSWFRGRMWRTGIRTRAIGLRSQTLGHTTLQMGNSYRCLRMWVPQAAPSLTRLSSSGLEEKRGLSERTWGGERGQGGHSLSPACPPPWLSCCVVGGGAHLLGEGGNVLVEGIRGADITSQGGAQPGPITGRAGGQFTFLKDQGQQREERVPAGSRRGDSSQGGRDREGRGL